MTRTLLLAAAFALLSGPSFADPAGDARLSAESEAYGSSTDVFIARMGKHRRQLEPDPPACSDAVIADLMKLGGGFCSTKDADGYTTTTLYDKDGYIRSLSSNRSFVLPSASGK
jgi:hypothetical protein